MSVFKQKRDELLKKTEYFNLAMAISNNCNNNLSDLINIKNTIISHSFSLTIINELYSMTLSEDEYVSFALELITVSKDGADSAIKLLERAVNTYPDINTSSCMDKILDLYDYWDAYDYSYGSVYSVFIELLETTFKEYPSENLAKKIIASMIIACGNRNFNNNYSVLDLFRILIEQYQELFLDKILPIINNESFDAYLEKRHLIDLFKFQHRADLNVYINWCKTNGKHAAEFVADFITVFKESSDGSLQWTVEIKELMNLFSDNTYVLSNISTRLFTGDVSVSKYKRLQKAYELLKYDNNDTIRLWAIKQSENLYTYIQKELKDYELQQVWDK